MGVTPISACLAGTSDSMHDQTSVQAYIILMALNLSMSN